MEAAAEEASSAYVAKGKRTKRLRVASPIHPANSSSESGGGVAYDHNGGTTIVNNNNTTFNGVYLQEMNNNNNTNEEEDMANCLILLAKGGYNGYNPTRNNNNNVSMQKVEDHNNNNNNINNFGTKFTSRKFLETANSSGSGKIGYYVYECKTCNRTFPSFQALGGHRASHKKPKALAMAMDMTKGFRHGMSAWSDEEDEGQFKNIHKDNNNNIASSLSLRLSDQHHHHHQTPNKGKVHECSICGAEFTSGQALGGHMRRHRGPVVGGGGGGGGGGEEAKKARNVFSLDLDLNLPAPQEDDNNKMMVPFASKQQQQQQQEKKSSAIVFTSPALVDCHY